MSTNPRVNELLLLAGRDADAVEELAGNARVDNSIVCLLSQQAVEKAIKAVILEYRIAKESALYTHDIADLLRIASQAVAVTPVVLAAVPLTDCAAKLRYHDSRGAIPVPRADLLQLVNDVLDWADALT